MPSGKSVCHLRLACNHVRRDETGAWQERPGFFDVSVFGPQADNVERFCRKGRPIAVDGRLEWREWETPDHHKRQAVSIVAHTVQFLGRPDGQPVAEGATAADQAAPADGAAPADDATPADGGDGADESEAAPVGDALVF
jgi:single-strand DNA-binding protein